MARLRFLRDYAALFREIGPDSFSDQFATPALVCRGIVAKLKPGGWGGSQTEIVIAGAGGPILRDKPQQVESLAQRVWMVIKAEEARKRPEITVGRTSGADVVISDHSLSRVHCAFRWAPDGLSLFDVGSSNGTQVRGEWLEPNRVVPLLDRDEIVLGRLGFEFLAPSSFLQRVLEYAEAER